MNRWIAICLLVSSLFVMSVGSALAAAPHMQGDGGSLSEVSPVLRRACCSVEVSSVLRRACCSVEVSSILRRACCSIEGSPVLRRACCSAVVGTSSSEIKGVLKRQSQVALKRARFP